MNPINFFKFLEKTESRPIDLSTRLIHDPKSITKDDLNVEGNLDLVDTLLKSLPAGLKVGGNLELWQTEITSLPADLKVGGNLDLEDTPLKSLPAGLEVGGNLTLWNTYITSLPADLKVGGEIRKDLTHAPLQRAYTADRYGSSYR